MNRLFRSAIFYLILIIAVVWVFNAYRNSSEKPVEIGSVNQWVQMVHQDQIASAKFLTKDEKVTGELTSQRPYEVNLPKDTIPYYLRIAENAKVPITAD